MWPTSESWRLTRNGVPPVAAQRSGGLSGGKKGEGLGVAGRKERAPQIGVAVARQAPQIGIERVDGLDPPGKPGVVQSLQDLARRVVGPRGV